MVMNLATYSKTKIFLGFALTGLVLCTSFYAHASVKELIDNYTEEYLTNGEGAGAEKESPLSIEGGESDYFYETPSNEALSHMFWGIGLYDVSDDWAVDEFMRLNECELYRQFFGDEFEWREIRSAAVDFIEQNRDQFPTRFEFILPIKLSDYNEKYGAFGIQKDYQIKSFRRFELFSSNYSAEPCLKEYPAQSGYPRSIVAEFSRPFTLTRIPMTLQQANEYIKQKNDLFNKWYPNVQTRSTKRLYELRDAFLSIKVSFFAHGEFLPLNNLYRVPVVRMMAILEGYAVYADRNKEELFYAQTYIRDKQKGKLNLKLGEQYEMLREKSKEGGVLR